MEIQCRSELKEFTGSSKFDPSLKRYLRDYNMGTVNKQESNTVYNWTQAMEIEIGAVNHESLNHGMISCKQETENLGSSHQNKETYM